MKTGFYLQFILTIIAINLTMLTLMEMDIILSANANEVSLDNSLADKPMDVNIVSVNGYSVFGGNLPIVVKDIETSDKLPVEVKGWQTSDRPQVEIKDWSAYDKIPVEVKNSYIYVKDY